LQNSRAQVGVEFFLLMGFALTVVGVLIANSEYQLSRNDRLDAAILGFSAMSTVASSANSVYLEGNGSSRRFGVFVPKDSKCFVARQESSYYILACDVGDESGRMARSGPLYAAPAPEVQESCYSFAGWVDVVVNNSGSDPFVGIYCKRMA